MRTSYWSNSKFADWIRGTPTGGAKSFEDWRLWEDRAKNIHPVRFWIAESLLRKVQNFIYWPVDKIYDFKYYINNRFITKSHCLVANKEDIRPGRWRDVGNRFFYCCFNELVNFVEVELAWSQIAWAASKHERSKYNPPFYAYGFFRIRTWRCPQAGIDNLKWQSDLVWTEDECAAGSKLIGKPTEQALAAKEILELYSWWTEVYRKRQDPHDESGWTDLCNKTMEDNGGVRSLRTLKNNRTTSATLKRLRKLEQAYKKQDDEMLIRLMKVRHHLWT